ncbi:MAG: hypothetical protein WC055_13180 [Melioribacteraceae bacterium]
MKALIKTTFLIGSTEFILLVVALLKNKYLAVTIGPEGLGMYSLLNSFFSIATIFSGTWLGSGLTKFASEYYTSNEKENLNILFVISAAFTLTIGAISVGSFILFKDFIIDSFLSTEVLDIYYTLFSLSFLGSSLRSILLSFLAGVKAIKRITYARIIIAVIEIISVGLLVYFFDLLGFFISILVVSIAAASILFSYSIKYVSIFFSFSNKILPNIKKLMNFASISAFLGLVYFFATYYQRKLITLESSFTELGIFQVGIAIIAYIGIALNGSDYYFYPKMSEKLDNKNLNLEINEYFSFTVVISAIICIGTILFGKLIIISLYSNQFKSLNEYLYIFVLAQFFNNTTGKVYGHLILGNAKLFAHSVASLLTSLSWVIIPFLLIKSIGILSVILSLIIGSLLTNLFRLVYSHINFDLIISLRNKKLLVLSLLGLLLSIISKDSNLLINLILMISIIAFYIVFYRNELVLIKKRYYKK